MAVRVEIEGIVFEGDTVAELLELIAAFGESDADDGWIEYDGNGQPVADETMVYVKFRNGSESNYVHKADYWDWSKPNSSYSITHYRIVSEVDA